MSSPTPRSQIRLAAVTGSLTAISDIANQSLSAQSRLEPAGAAAIGATDLEGILGQLAASVKRIQGDDTKDFTGVAAGVFKHATAQFIGVLSASSDLKVGGHITGSGDAILGGDLQVKGNDIKDGNGDIVITMSGDGNKLTTLAGDIKVTGNTIKSSTADALELLGADVEVKGDLQVTGNDIKASDGTATITMSARDVTIAGDLQVSGNDIKSSTGAVAIQLTGSSVTVSGNEIISGTLTAIGVISGSSRLLVGSHISGSGDIKISGMIDADNAKIGGGFGSSGVTIYNDGAINADGGIFSMQSVSANGGFGNGGTEIGRQLRLGAERGLATPYSILVGDYNTSTKYFEVTAAGAISGSGGLQIGGNITGSNMMLYGDLALNGGDITTTQTTATVFNANATSVNIAGGATSGVNIGNAASDVVVAGDLKIAGNDIKASDGSVTITMSGRDVIVAGDVAVNGGDVITSQTTATLFNTVATTVNMAGAATAVSIGASTGLVTLAGDLQVAGNDIQSSTGAVAIQLTGSSITVSGNEIVSGTLTTLGIISGSSDLQIGGNITGSNALFYNDVAINGGDITTTQASFNFVTASTAVVIGNNAGTVTVAGDLIVSGNDIKDSASVTRITFDDGVPVYSTQNLTFAIDGDTQTYSGDQGTITFPASWITEVITLASTSTQRSFVLPSVLSSLSNALVAVTSWDNQTYSGGSTITVAPGVSGTITISDANGGSFTNGSITVTAYAPTLTASLKVAADLRVMGNDIRDSNNDTVITLSGDGQKRTILAGDLELDGNKIRASDGLTTITLSNRNVITSGSVNISGSTMAFVGSGANADASVDLLTGGILTLRGGNLTGSYGSVAVRMSGSTLEFSDQYMAGTWSDAGISLADSSAEWQSYVNTFGQRSIISAISAGASGFGDGLHLYKVASPVTGPVTINGSSLTRPGGTTFTNSFLATPGSSRNENIRMYLNGQLLVSKSFDATDYDYDVAWDGSTITFKFNFDVDDTISAITPLSVASTDNYIATIGYDLCATVNGKPASSEVVFKLIMPRTAMFNGGYAYVDIAATSQVVLKIQKGVYSAGSITYSDIGTITYAAGAASGTVAWTGGSQNVSRGDVLRVVAPSSVDATFSSPAFTLIGLES